MAAHWRRPISPRRCRRRSAVQRTAHFGAAVEAALLARLEPQDRRRHSHRRREIRAPDRPGQRARSAGDRHRPRAARADFASGAARRRGLMQPGSLVRWTTRVLMGGRAARRMKPRSKPCSTPPRRAFREAGWEARSRQCFPGFRSRSRSVRRVPDAGRAGVAGRRRGRRRQRGAGLRRAQARDAGDPQGARRDRRASSRWRWSSSRRRADRRVRRRWPRRGDPVRRRLAVRTLLPLPLAPSIYPSEIALGVAFGLLTALAFSIAPLGRAHDLPGDDAVPRSRRGASGLAPQALPRRRGARGTALVALAILTSPQRSVATTVVVATLAAFLALRLVALGDGASRGMRPSGALSTGGWRSPRSTGPAR